MRAMVACVTTVLLLVLGSAAAGLDCERVRVLDREGKRASEIARELGITTPDVQECLAAERDETGPAGLEASGASGRPTLPGADAALPRPPNQ